MPYLQYLLAYYLVYLFADYVKRLLISYETYLATLS